MCEGVGYELSPADRWGNGAALDEETATEWIRKLKANVDTLCFDAVGVSVDDLRGVEWLNGVGRLARDGCVAVDMQCEDVVKSIRGLMDNPECLWLQVDVSGGGWTPCDAPVVVDDGYVVAGALDEVGAGVHQPKKIRVAKQHSSMYILCIPHAVLHSQRPPTSDLHHVPSFPVLYIPNACPRLICTICYLFECCAFPTSNLHYMPSVRVLYLPNVRSALYAIYFNHVRCGSAAFVRECGITNTVDLSSVVSCKEWVERGEHGRG